MSMKKIITLIIILGFFTESFSQETYMIENLNINTEYSDFGANYYKDGQLVFSSSKNPGRIIKRTWKQNSQPFLDFYVVENKSINSLEDVKSFSNKINTKYHEGILTFTKDFKTVYFTRDNYLNGKLGKSSSDGKVNLKIYKADLVGEKWENIEELPFNSDYYSTGHPVLSKDGKQLYFASDRPGGYGNTDIYVVDILGKNKFSKPRNLGAFVNTTAKEEFPFIDENNTLFFASNRDGGYGGLDIYYTFSADNNFSTPQNLGLPLNSTSDDFAFVKENGKNKGLFSSNRYGGKGDDDIYSFEGKLPEKCNSNVIITVVDETTNTPLSGASVKVLDSKGDVIKQSVTTNNGLLTLDSDCDKSYKVTASKDNYNEVTKTIVTTNGKVNLGLGIKENPKPKEVQPSIVNESDVNYDSTGRLMINIENIYYDTNKSNIRLSERSKLDRLITLMNKYPNIKVEIGSHTDCRGRNSYNMKLSDRRAVSARQYVISRGIDSNRIFGKGYGENSPINNCNCSYKCSKEEYQENRRTEFVIIEQ